MSRELHKKESHISIAIVVAIVLTASVLLIVRPAPERIFAVSEDRIVRIEGVTRTADQITIERLDGVEHSVSGLLSPIYEIGLVNGGVVEAAEIEFSFSQFAGGHSIQDVSVYTFESSELTWVALPTFFDLAKETVSAQATISGSLMVGLGIPGD